MTRVRDILKRYPGGTEVVLVIDSTEPSDPDQRTRYVLTTPSSMNVSCSAGLRTELEAVLGEEHIRYHAPARTKPAHNGNRTAVGV